MQYFRYITYDEINLSAVITYIETNYLYKQFKQGVSSQRSFKKPGTQTNNLCETFS